ncbi:TPA: hypothetical protein HA265_01795 [Candidatus Woesearchaeota archaeon]|nr:hypothetical protein [Candidatus Woesearchaeota archaeon]
MTSEKDNHEEGPEYDLDLDLAQTVVEDNTRKAQRLAACSSCACDAEEEDAPEDEKKDTKKLLWLVGVIIIVFGVLGGVAFYSSYHKEPVTIDGMHSLNVAGELKPQEGYMYNGYSFIKYADVWYTQIQNKGTLYDVTFNYDPKSVEDIPIEGSLTENFVKSGRIYITFDPLGRELKWVAVANFGLSRSLAWAFGYDMKAACTRNETKACQDAGVVTCDDTEKAVIYFKESDDPRVILADNCVIVQGRGEDLVKAKDRLLLRWYGITGKIA